MEGEKVIVKKVRRGGEHGGHHGGSWKVAYADFVTAMMAFFLLMWLLTSLKAKQKMEMATYFKEYNALKGKKDIEQKIDLKMKAIMEAVKPDGQGRGDLGVLDSGITVQRDEFMKVMKNEIEVRLSDVQGQVLVDITPDGAVRIQLVDVEGSPMFTSGSAEPTAVARKILGVIAERIRNADVKIAIEGHTDAYAYSSAGLTNWELSTQRASAARRELETDGYSPDRLLRVTGLAATQPLVGDNPFDPRNRRISILVYYR
jgi:chemotaxis protein MotB